MKNVVILCSLMTLFHFGSSLSCYKCNGCETATFQKETCRNVDPETQDSFCLTQKVHFGGTPPTTLKKCAVFEKNKRFNCQQLPDSETMACDVCQTDFCNGTTRTLFAIPVVTFCAVVSLLL